ncbi:hypothetical protein [Pelotalea chapellei]|uniref:Uncharacterized protein n=1 Tax=Pelotalea chapellei TaxID=44671 RepID=A0ABS5UAT1_9BACT|nr:hypothetical protein [Pelotalea chapellei]MBT1072774.1 hypothetical protein [Pelotalea chapellei]
MRCLAQKTIHLLILLVIVLPTAVHAKELEIGMSIFAARKLLINKGWRPINIKDKILPNSELEKSFLNAHIIEVESCAMDMPSCIFNYKKGDKCLRLYTLGEEIKDMRVNYWTYDCADKNIKAQNKQPDSADKKEEMGKPFLDNGKPFIAIRKLLINKGWKPVNVHKSDDYKSNDMTSRLLIYNIIEVESCNIDMQNCIFNYKKGKVCLRLFTVGEEINDLNVNYWTFDCLDED